MTLRHSRSRFVRRGAAAVELAVVLPVLLLLAIGCIDVGRGLSAAIAVSNAARVGADWAATHRFTDNSFASWSANIESEAAAEMEGLQSFSASDLDVEIGWVDQAGEGNRVTVTASYVYRTAVDWPGLPHEFPLRQSVTVSQYR